MKLKKLKFIVFYLSFILLHFSCKFKPTIAPMPSPFSFKVGQHAYNCANTMTGLESPRTLLLNGRAKLRVSVSGVNYTPQFQQTTTFFHSPTLGYEKNYS